MKYLFKNKKALTFEQLIIIGIAVAVLFIILYSMIAQGKLLPNPFA